MLRIPVGKRTRPQSAHRLPMVRPAAAAGRVPVWGVVFCISSNAAGAWASLASIADTPSESLLLAGWQHALA